jgi:hypothetical protein
LVSSTCAASPSRAITSKSGAGQQHRNDVHIHPPVGPTGFECRDPAHLDAAGDGALYSCDANGKITSRSEANLIYNQALDAENQVASETRFVLSDDQITRLKAIMVQCQTLGSYE